MFSDDTIEFIFFHVKEIEAAIMEKRLDSGGGKTGGNGTGHSQISDTTAIKAIRAATELNCVAVEFGAAINGKCDVRFIKRPETWLEVVKDTHDFYLNRNRQIDDFLTSRYDKNDTWQETCDKLNIRKSEYYAYKADVIHTAELYAVGYGLLSPWHKLAVNANMGKI